MELLETFRRLHAAYGPRRWWPTTLPGDERPSYHGFKPDARQRFEIAAGAILTQNTNWGNVERALANLGRAATLSPERVLAADPEALAELIRPSGYYRMKAAKLRNLAAWWLRQPAAPGPSDLPAWRESLLTVNGVGPETADSILLYAFGLPTFVVDAYTKRAMARHHGTPEDIPYHELRGLFMAKLPPDVELYQEFHALFVELAKDACRKNACLERCPLRKTDEQMNR